MSRYRKPAAHEIERSLCLEVVWVYETAEKEARPHTWILDQLHSLRERAKEIPQYRRHAVNTLAHTLLDVVHRKLEWRHKVDGVWVKSPLPEGSDYGAIEDSAHFWPGTDGRF